MKCKKGFKKVGDKCKKVKKFSTKLKDVKLKFGRPDRWEVLCIILYSMFLYLFNDIVNIFSGRGGWEVTTHLISNVPIPLVGLMWTSFILFHIFLMVTIGRSIWKKDNSTHHYWDLLAGTIVLFGVFLLLIPTVIMLEGGGGVNYMIPWLFGIGRGTTYHAGIFLQIVGLVYFALTK